MDREYLKLKTRTIPNFPKEGIMFRDVTTLFKDKKALKIIIDDLATRYSMNKPDYIVGIESRGFVIGSALAYALGIGFIPVRKKGKLPAKTISIKYDLEYGSAELEIHKDSLSSGERVVIIDDLLATGGTVLATSKLIKQLGGKIIECAFIVNLPELSGEKKLKESGLKVYSQIEFLGE